jgi:hypothetical protein
MVFYADWLSEHTGEVLRSLREVEKLNPAENARVCESLDSVREHRDSVMEC